MFKSKIFFKIISIFTLPILLILFYSTFLVYQKNIESKEVEVLKNNVIFVKNIKELIFAIDKEQNSIKKYLSTQKETLDLQKDYKTTNDAYTNLMSSVKILNLQLKVENLNYYIDEIENLRLNVQNKTVNLLDINTIYLNKVYFTQRDIHLRRKSYEIHSYMPR